MVFLGQKGNMYRGLVGKPKERPLGRCRQIWEGDVEMNPKSRRAGHEMD